MIPVSLLRARRLIRRPTSTLLAAHAGYRILIGIWWIILARFFAPEYVGLLSLANAVSVLVFTALDAGTSQLFVREYRPDLGYPTSMKRQVARRYVLGLIGLGATIGSCSFLTDSLRSGLLVASAVGGGYALDFMVQMWLAPDRMLLNNVPDTVAKLMQGGLALITITVLAATSADLATLSITIVASYVAAAWSPWRRWRARVVFTDLLVGPSQASRRVVISAGILITIYTRIDTLAVQIVTGAAGVAIYSVSFKLIESARLPGWALGRTALAQASGGDVLPSGRLIGGFFLGCGLASFVFCGGPWLQEAVYGSEYGGSVPSAVIRLLTPSIVTASLTAPLSAMYLGAGDELQVMRAAALTTAVTVVSLAVLVPLHGLVGAAGAALAGETTSAYVYLRSWRRQNGALSLALPEALCIFIACCCCAGALAAPAGGTTIGLGTVAALPLLTCAARRFAWL